MDIFYNMSLEDEGYGSDSVLGIYEMWAGDHFFLSSLSAESGEGLLVRSRNDVRWESARYIRTDD
jgi:hypothetical protein